jgi:hypothetical protein
VRANCCHVAYVDAHGRRPANQRSSFDKAGEEDAYQFTQIAAMKQQFPPAPFLTPRQETARVYFAMILSGAIILLMILAEMKFFGT